MKRNTGLSNIRQILQNTTRHMNLSRRRYARRGGVRGAVSRFVLGVKKGNRRCLAGLGAAIACLILLVCLPMTLRGGKEKEPREIYASEDVVSLEGDYQARQADILAKEAAAGPTPRPIYFQSGFEDEDIAQIQQRLMDLSYMDNDEPTNFFGPNTKEAVELFQRRHGLTITGVVDKSTYQLLFSDQALTYMVCVGISGTDVEELQGRLREMDYLDKATGYFGDETEAAVKEFQKNNRLTQDGKVGAETREMLYSEDAVPKSLHYGEQSPEVRSYQKRLFKLGYLTTEPDGTFGRDTVNAVKMFQQQNGLIVDGHIGPMTKELLMSSSAKASVISLGDRNRTVTKIQEQLKKLGYLDSRATGYFGSSTEAAVVGFQRQNKLSRDGKVGRTTMKTLFSDSARRAPADYAEPEMHSSGSSSHSGGSSSGELTGSMGSLDRFISAARSKLGSRYVRGGKGPDKFDCSGFVYWCLRQAGVNQRYLTSSGWRGVSGYTKVRSISDLRRGDVIVFRGHVAIAMGDGTMIDASSTHGKVVHRSCTGNWSQRNFICGWRIF